MSLLNKILKQLKKSSQTNPENPNLNENDSPSSLDSESGIDFALITDIELNRDYPVYGMITGLLDESLNNFWVEVNYNMKVRMNLTEDNQDSKINIIKERMFDVGIFILQFTHKFEDLPENKYILEAECSCVIFGKSEAKSYH